MRYLLVILVAVAALVWTAPASTQLIVHPKCTSMQCRETSQSTNLKHAKFLCHYGRNKTRQWGCAAVRWLEKELKETELRLHPWGNMPIKDYILKYHPCLAGIIKRENSAYDPTLNFGGGHGDTSVAYGIPQAMPGTKMASAGPDWATNPWTQLKWMIGYTVGKFGSECNALYHRVHYNMY